jgi:hypothetical protein
MKIDLLPAIREDHNPLALVGLLGGLQAAPLIFLRWTSYSCPHCGRTFRRDFWQYNVGLGSGKRVCRQCGKFFDDGTREWPDLPSAKKLRFLFPPLLVAVCGLGGQLKTGQLGSLQNRPTDVAQDQGSFIPFCPDRASLFWFSSSAARI